jgi:2-polyprenyl-6-methoxyphenol hydroxylase-like FAD-dependent oxidoreductase
MKTTTDVLIAGAGPVGLLLATELLRDGVDVLLIDRLRTRSFFCKALGVTPRTLEIFDDIGIAQDAIDSGVWLQGVSAFNDGVPGPSMDVPTGLPFGNLSLAQFHTERLLEACLHRCGGSVSYGHTLTGFEAKPDGVRAQVQAPDGQTRSVDGRWLVGCDGAHSKVRATLGLDFAGGQYPQTFILADLEVDWDLPRGRMYWVQHRGSRATWQHGSGGGSGARLLSPLPVVHHRAGNRDEHAGRCRSRSCSPHATTRHHSDDPASAQRDDPLVAALVVGLPGQPPHRAGLC